jgi:hypothetical protein
VKRTRRLLWSVNALLAVSILAFGARTLAFPPKIDRLTDIDPRWADATPRAALPPPPNEEALRTLRNPLRPPEGPTAPVRPPIALKGALPAEGSNRGAVFIKVGSTETIALPGERILKDGRPFPEFAGWRLAEVWKDRAVFTNPSGERIEVAMDSAHESAAISRSAGDPYRPDLYRSRRIAFSEGREIWSIDEREVDWVGRNAETILDRELQLSLHAGGGVRLERLEAGSIGTARGFQPGDVVREINGRPINSLADLRLLFASAPRNGFQLTLDRAGRPLVLEYRPLPR